MPLPLGVLLEGVGHGDGPVTQVLTVHRLDGCVRRVEAGEVDEGVTLGVPRVGVSHDLGGLQDDAERAERVVQELLVDLGVQVPDEDVRSHVQVLVVSRGFVHADGFTVQLYHVHDLYSVISIFFTEELHKTVTLMLSRHSVFGHVCVHHRSSLKEEFP